MIEKLQSVNLLYAEDEIDIQESMQEYFESYFNSVYIASDGKKALEIYNKYRPEVVILDINIPDINGLDIAKKIREKDKYTRIVIMSAYSELEYLLQAAEIDMSKYLLKPVSPTELKEVLTKISQELFIKKSEIIKLDTNLYFELATAILTLNSIAIPLLEKEKKLLQLLVEKKNSCVSYKDIMVHVWLDIDEDVSRDSIKSQVNYLRKKLPINIINNIYGKGYIINIPL